MKKLFLLLASAFCLNASAALSDTDLGNNNYINEWGRLKLVGNQLSSESGQPVQLKGWSSFSTHYGEVAGCLSNDQFAKMKLWGANMVRIAMYLDDHGGYMSNKTEETQKMKNYIDWAEKNGIYILVDWHVLETEGGQSGNPKTYQEDAKTFFSNISSYVKEKGYKHVLYEICNEPDNRVGWDGIKQYAETVLPSIAGSDPNAVVVVGTPSWDQEILSPVRNGRVNHSSLQIMYAFHYYACSHSNLLGNFSSATASIPVFASEWSGVTFSGDGNLCESEADRFLGYCTKNEGSQLVSWCFWNWGFKTEGSSTFSGSCGEANSLTTIGNYIIDRLGGCETCDVPVSAVYERQNIPSSRDIPFQFSKYDNGGEGVAYHDANSEALEKDEDGEILGYINFGDNYIGCNIAESYGYAGRIGKMIEDTFAFGKQWSKVPDLTDNCLDVSGCSGPDGKKSWTNICWTEPDEWANYSVDVKQAGYYKLEALSTLDTDASGKFSITKVGKNGGNMLRDIEDKTNYEIVGASAQVMSECASSLPWECWEWKDVVYKRGKGVYVLFPEAGEQVIKVIWSDAVGNVGPLNFEFAEGHGAETIPADDPLLKEEGEETEINEIASNNSAIYTTDGGIVIYSEETGVATISTAAGTSKVVNIAKGDNKINVAPGLYIVNLTTASASRVEKVLVK